MRRRASAQSGPGSARRRILVVEDDQPVQEMVTTHLEREGYDVLALGSGEDVLDRFGAGALTYDVALTDVHLPGISGIELTRLLLATAPLNPVILITGDDDERLAGEALEHGAASYLLKPFQLFELDAALAQAFSMLDLVEATETLARAQAGNLDDWGEAGGMLPRAWLRVGDERSDAGAGHGSRVGNVVGLLGNAVGSRLDSRDLDVLRTAARTHEIGRLLGPGTAPEVAGRTAQLLDNLGFDPGVGEVVRDAVVAWSPGLPLTAMVLSAADRLDHDAVRRAAAVDDDARAIRGAVDAMLEGSGETVDPAVAEALRQNRAGVESMWVTDRGRSR